MRRAVGIAGLEKQAKAKVCSLYSFSLFSFSLAKSKILYFFFIKTQFKEVGDALEVEQMTYVSDIFYYYFQFQYNIITKSYSNV